MKKRYTEEQIIGFLREADAGIPVKELCRRHGISEATFYNWKAKYSGMTVSEARRLKELEADGLIRRKEFKEIPPRVEYSLTETGRSLSSVFNALEIWGVENVMMKRSN